MRIHSFRSKLAVGFCCATIGVGGALLVAGCSHARYVEADVAVSDEPYYSAPYYTGTVWIGPGYYYDQPHRIYHYYHDHDRWERHDWDRDHDRSRPPERRGRDDRNDRDRRDRD